MLQSIFRFIAIGNESFATLGVVNFFLFSAGWKNSLFFFFCIRGEIFIILPIFVI